MAFFFPSRLKAAGLVIASSVMTAAAGWIVTEDPELLMTEHPQVLFVSCVAGVILYGAFAVRWTRELFRVEPVLEIGPAGIVDRRLGPDLIPWSIVRSIKLVDGRRRAVLALSVDPPPGSLSRTPGMRRYVVGKMDRTGFWTVRVSLTGLDRNADAVLKAVGKAVTARNRAMGVAQAAE